MREIVGEIRTNSEATFSHGALHTKEQVLDSQLELIYNSSVQTQNVVYMTCWKQWMKETCGEKVSEKSMLTARHDDDDNIDF